MQPTTLLHTESMLLTALNTAIRAIPMLYLQVAVLALWILLFIYLRKMLKQKKRLLVALLFALLAGSGLLLALKYTMHTRVYITTKGSSSAIYSGPGTNFTILGYLPANEELIKLQEVGAFVKARYKGAIVWIGIDHVAEAKHNR